MKWALGCGQLRIGGRAINVYLMFTSQSTDTEKQQGIFLNKILMHSPLGFMKP
jgi:hypothetical protein